MSKESFITSRSENESLPLAFLALFFKQKRKEKKARTKALNLLITVITNDYLVNYGVLSIGIFEARLLKENN